MFICNYLQLLWDTYRYIYRAILSDILLLLRSFEQQNAIGHRSLKSIRNRQFHHSLYPLDGQFLDKRYSSREKKEEKRIGDLSASRFTCIYRVPLLSMDDSVAISNVATANQHRQSQLKAPHRRSEIDIGKQKRQFQASTSRVTCTCIPVQYVHTRWPVSVYMYRTFLPSRTYMCTPRRSWKC